MSVKKPERSWSYTGDKGQITWFEKYPSAMGLNQSPVNIYSRETTYDESLSLNNLDIRYSVSREIDLLNTGESVRFSPRCKSSVMGGPLPPANSYELSDVMFHWGEDDTRGSEHTVNGKSLPMELHLMHWNRSLFRSLNDAQGKPGGLLIIAIFIQIGREHQGLKAITDNLEEILYKGREKSLNTGFNPNCLLPDPTLRDYWTYQGSLTTPPCDENVTWVVFRYPLTISHSQMEEFRRLRTHAKSEVRTSTEEGAMVDNFRVVQPLNDRVISASFQ